MSTTDNWRKGADDEELFKFDPYAHAVTAIGENHRMIHDGFYFDVSGFAAGIANGGNLDILIKCPAASPVHFTLAGLAVEDTPWNIYFYEGTTVSADGTSVPVRNHNRYGGSDTRFATTVFTGPTVTGVGTQIHTDYIPPSGAGANSGQLIPVLDTEWVLGDPDNAVNYLIRATNNSGVAADIGWHLNGYEIGYEI